MSIFGTFRCALILGAAAALLAGCGGSQPLLSTQPQGFASPQSLPQRGFRVLHNFCSSGDGTNPAAPLIEVNGTFYGTTAKGGAYGYGTVFSITTSDQETVLHSFGGAGDGAQPEAALLDVNGTLYGTTSQGGAAHNAGTVFSITPSGTEQVLHSFDYAGTGGAAPVASLIDVDGTLYGTTSAGGHGSGTVFSITTDGQYNVLHAFGRGHDGISPEAGLLYIKGRLFGTTTYGGAYGSGTVFSVSKGGKEQVLHSFYVGYGGDGALPTAGLIEANGMLYGTTSEAGVSYSNTGTIFSITTDGSENVIHTFKGSDGSHPVSALTNVNGELYGTTSQGGLHDVGTIFKISKDRNYIVLHNFGNGSGDSPYASLLEVGRTLYGTTYGVVENHVGNVFSFTP
jgi:uncharacterized repeat protein (TIGR03803 family)